MIKIILEYFLNLPSRKLNLYWIKSPDLKKAHDVAHTGFVVAESENNYKKYNFKNNGWWSIIAVNNRYCIHDQRKLQRLQ
jgi:hypothetical protein